jgi:hypothetical protein
MPATAPSGATKVILADPVTVATAQYRPLPASGALGPSAFYMALLTLMCGFLVDPRAHEPSRVRFAAGGAAVPHATKTRDRRSAVCSRYQCVSGGSSDGDDR